MSITRAQIARQLLAQGGSPGNTTRQRVLPRADGKRPGYYGSDAGFGDDDYKDESASFDSGSGSGGSDQDFANARAAMYGTSPQITESSNYIPSKTKTNFARGINFLNPTISRYAIDRGIVNQYEEDQTIASDVLGALNTGYGQAIGSQYFGAVNSPMRESYARTTGLTGPTGPPNIGDDNNNVIIPPILRLNKGQSAQVPSDIESKPSDFDLYAALEGRENMNFGMNPNNMTGAMQRFSDGGEVRQRYGLGSFVRKIKSGVKKGISGIKKFAKSDLGKAALLYAGGTYLGGMKAFGGSGIGGKGLGKFGFQNFGKRLFSPTGTDGFSNIFNPLRSGGEGFKLPFVQTEEQKAAELAKKIGLIDNSKLSDPRKKKLKDDLITKSLGIGGDKTKIPALVKYGIPLAMAASYQFTKNEQPDDLDQEIMENYKDTSGLKEQIASYPEFRFQVPEQYRLADGGRIGYDMGGDVMMASDESNTRLLEQLYEDFLDMGFSPKEAAEKAQKAFNDMSMKQKEEPNRVMAQEGGIMNLGGLEKDYREGGFVPIGVEEKADDVPARLSKNEFVFTADAVRAAGGGSVDKGADLMYKTMKNLESRVG